LEVRAICSAYIGADASVAANITVHAAERSRAGPDRKGESDDGEDARESRDQSGASSAGEEGSTDEDE
jgi:hypothetical protein